MNWYLAQVLGIAIVCVLMVTVGWELYHLFEWFSFLSDDPLHYLRMHAYDYVGWMFGTDFGWVVE